MKTGSNFTYRVDMWDGRQGEHYRPSCGRFSLGFVSWVEANGWGALAFQAHFGVGGQSKT
jgi:hypothetical protein